MNQPSSHKPDSSPKAVLLGGTIFFSIFALAVLIIAASNQFDPVLLFKAVVEYIFISHYSNFNVFQPGTVDGANVVTAFEMITLVAILITVFIFTFFLNILMPAWRLSTSKAMTVSWLMAFIIFSFLVQLKRAQALDLTQKKFGSLKLEDRIESIIGMPYVFAHNCSQKLKKPMNIEYLTDVPPTQDPYMTQQRGLSYYFYPKISVRIPREGERVGNLYFYKKDVSALIPKDHRIVCQSNDLNFVLTVNKNKYDEYVIR